MSISEWPWSIIGAAISGVILLISIVVNVVKPEYRRWRLKRPVRAYFHVRAIHEGPPLPYLFQNDHAHNVKELVLPANAEVEIEVAYNPLIDFHLEEGCFAIEGEQGTKPSIEKRIVQFVAKHVDPAVDLTAKDYWDRKGNYHFIPRSSGRSIGSCYTTGFILQTHVPGTYRAWIGFLTDGRDGSAEDLRIVVAERSDTRMRCIEHWRCYVKPTLRK